MLKGALKGKRPHLSTHGKALKRPLLMEKIIHGKVILNQIISQMPRYIQIILTTDAWKNQYQKTITYTGELRAIGPVMGQMTTVRQTDIIVETVAAVAVAPIETVIQTIPAWSR